MSKTKVLRSLNPRLQYSFQSLPRYTHGKSQLKYPEDCQNVINKLNIKEDYNQNHKLNIIDVNPGFGLFSSMINYELQPKKHVLLEKFDENYKNWMNRIETLKSESNNQENFEILKNDPFDWDTYTKLFNDGVIEEPNVKWDDKINDELLVLANWTGKSDESIIAQWIGCCGNRNWLMKYGKVRMIILMPSITAMKFLSEPGFRKRNRTSLKRDLYTKTKLIAIGEDSEILGQGYDPRILVRDQPLVIKKNSFIRSPDVAIIEMTPGEHKSDSIANIEHLLSGIFVSSSKLKDLLPRLAPGAEYLQNYLTNETLEKRASEFTTEDILQFSNAYEQWPFKPSTEETFDINEYDF
ncbi:MTF1 [Candida pseudojiufengensis]|uniref:MTF1 n=1 Tax=Candida pseudojiufengensis TaxID=497109 RepID=UPI0022247F60|nr:MTF1 [Candida pseudojiufengensis]KAI5960144.1 MTF1 [Candida pseudojiufengensis]